MAAGRRIGRWMIEAVVLVAIAAVLFEASGQSSTRPAPVRANAYSPIDINDRDVRTALNFAMATQKKINRNPEAIVLREVLTAEHQASEGDKFRLCLSVDRRGRTVTARAIVRRSPERDWSVALWAWSACGQRK
jgi:hypothetical protein